MYQVKITFKHLRFERKAYITCRKRDNPPGIEVLNFSFFSVYSRLKVAKQSILIKKNRTLRRFAKQRAILDLSIFV